MKSCFTVRQSAGLLSALLLVCSANAAKPSWPAEPRSVFGVALGQAIDDATVPKCPQEDYSRGLPPPITTLCQQPSTSVDGIWLRGTPDIGFEQSTVITLFEGKVMQIAFNFRNYQFDQATAVLIQRYGQPTERRSDEFTARSGAKVSSSVLTWTGPNTVLVAMERNGNLDIGQIAFVDLRQFAEMEKAKQEAAKRGASRL